MKLAILFATMVRPWARSGSFTVGERVAYASKFRHHAKTVGNHKNIGGLTSTPPESNRLTHISFANPLGD